MPVRGNRERSDLFEFNVVGLRIREVFPVPGRAVMYFGSSSGKPGAGVGIPFGRVVERRWDHFKCSAGYGLQWRVH